MKNAVLGGALVLASSVILGSSIIATALNLDTAWDTSLGRFLSSYFSSGMMWVLALSAILMVLGIVLALYQKERQ